MARGYLINPASRRRVRQAKRRNRRGLTSWQKHVKKFKTRSGKLDLKAAARAWKRNAMSPGQARAMTKYRKRKSKGKRGGGRFIKGLMSGWQTTRRAKSTRKRKTRRKVRRRNRVSTRPVRVRRKRLRRKARRVKGKLKRGARAMARRRRRKTRRRARNPYPRVRRRRRVSRRRNRVRRRRRRNPLYRTRRGRFTGRKTGRRANRRRRNRRRRNPLSALAGLLANPRRRRRSRRRRNASRRRRHYARRRNPSMGGVVSGFKALMTKPALMDYAAVSGGFVAGGILPNYLAAAASKVGIDVSSPLARAGLGLAGSLLAGLAVGMATKKRDLAVKVAAGGVAGVVGMMALEKVSGMLPGVSGYGLGADSDIRRAVEGEIKRQMGLSGSFGEYVSPSSLSGYVTPGAVIEAPQAAGLGLETADDIPDVDTFGDPGW